MTVSYINGFETGDAGELVVLGSGASIVTTPVKTGGYALKQAGGGSYILLGGSVGTFAVRFAFYMTAIPAGNQLLFNELTGASTARWAVYMLTNGKLDSSDLSGTLGTTDISGTTVLAINTWYLIDLVFDPAAGGVLRILLNGVAQIDATHSNDVSATPTAQMQFVGQANPNEWYIDDIRMDTATTTVIGPGRIIARQGLAGTPNADVWAKNGAATAPLCWSDTPFATATNCTSSTSAAAQTMLVAAFNAIQAGHGSDVIGAGDTVNGAKTVVVAKRATSGSPQIRRRIAAANTDTTVAMTSSDACWNDGIWAVSLANLLTAEVGMVKAADTNLTTCEDCWLMVDYTDVLMGASIM